MTMPRSIRKSSRYQRVIGNLGEMVVANWLARCGFEVAIVDQTGIDLIAAEPDSGHRLGISVKARTRLPKRECNSVTLFKDGDDRERLEAVCKTFGCDPWVAVYVETS